MAAMGAIAPTIQKLWGRRHYFRPHRFLECGGDRISCLLWPPYVIGAIIFLPCSFFLSSVFYLYIFFFSSPNLSGHRLDVYLTSTHGVAIVRI